ncbi:MAG: M1 family metallopeptidase [Dehalococcoidia bacterium]|nr:M1 family metallopeptidase [Dehalococcoidia bacterium]
MKTRLAGVLLCSLALTAGANVAQAQEPGPESATVVVEVTVWRSVANPDNLYVSTRPEGGRWRTNNTPLDMSGLNRTRRFHQSNAVRVEVPLGSGQTAMIDVTVWRSVANPANLYISTRAEGERWRTDNTPLDMSGLNRTGRFHQSNAVAVGVEVRLASTDASETETLGYIPLANATVVALDFFEAPLGLPPLHERVFRTTFDRSVTRYITWQLRLVHPPPAARIDFSIDTTIYRSDGSVAASFASTSYIDEGWTSSYRSSGWGSATGGSWQPGIYRAELAVGGEPIARAGFEVVDQPVPDAGAFAELRETLPWAAGPLDHDSRVALLALAGLHEADPVLVRSVAPFSWVREGPGGHDLRALQQLDLLAREHLGVARRVAAYEWLADGVSEDEWLGLRALAGVIAREETAGRALAGYEWMRDGITENERAVLTELRELAVSTPFVAQITAFPWVRDSITEDERWTVRNLEELADSEPELASLVLDLAWIRDDVTEYERWIVWNLFDLGVSEPELTSLIASFPWFQDDVTEQERWIVRNLNDLASVDGQLANLLIDFPWFQDDVTAHERRIVWNLKALHEGDDQLASLVVDLPWFQDDVTEHERWLVRNLLDLGASEPELAGLVASFPWFQDGVTESERWTVRNLTDLALVDLQLTGRVAGFRWFQDDITEDERWTVWSLRAWRDQAVDVLGTMLFLDTLSPSGVAAATALSDLSRRFPEGFSRVLGNPAVEDGITEDETAVVSTLSGVYQTNPDLIETLLDPARVLLEERTLELPVSGEAHVTVIRTKAGAGRTMDLIEDAAVALEDLMGEPLPSRQVTFLFEDAVLPTFLGANWGTHISLLPEVDSTAMSRTRAYNPIVHELAHYYWRGNAAWVDEGIANLLATVVDGTFKDLPERDAVFPCPYARRISDLESIGPQQRSRQFLCSYSLGERLFRDLYRKLGEDFWDGLQRLYEKSLLDDDSDECSGTSLGACHVESAFKEGGSQEVLEAVDEVFDFWYEKREPEVEDSSP